ncbi:MAG: hypothetical protein K2M48_04130, partial [Clostridiales bacterium]|nr:hypothetical protein [Clostridiales bacterium]
MNYIAIKLYKPPVSPEYSEYAEYNDSFDYYYELIKKHAKECGRIFLFAMIGIDSCSKAFADFEYSGELSKNEQKKWVELVKPFFCDADVEYEHHGDRIEMKFKEKNRLK